MKKIGEGNHDKAWNDPPVFAYQPAAAARRRTVLNKRVAFPLNPSSAADVAGYPGATNSPVPAPQSQAGPPPPSTQRPLLPPAGGPLLQPLSAGVLPLLQPLSAGGPLLQPPSTGEPSLLQPLSAGGPLIQPPSTVVPSLLQPPSTGEPQLLQPPSAEEPSLIQPSSAEEPSLHPASSDHQSAVLDAGETVLDGSPAADVSISCSSSDGEEMARRLNALLDRVETMDTVAQQEVQLRVEVIRRLWVRDRLDQQVRIGLTSIVHALETGLLDSAEDTMRALTVDHASQCVNWMAAIRQLIFQLKSPIASAAAEQPEH